jgi:hypothetical protein
MAVMVGEDAAALADRLDTLTDRATINRWLYDALQIGIDPL